MNKESDWVVLGRLGRPQGLRGLIRVISFTEPESNILDYLPWHIQKNGHWVPLRIDNFQTQNQTILVKIEGYTEREAVAELTNCNIAVLREQLPKLPEGDFYWHELQNMMVQNKEGAILGQVVDIMPTGTHEVLVIQGEKQHLIPYVPDIYIVKVDSVQRQITVDWDEND